MTDSRLQNALRQIHDHSPGLVPTVALERAIALAQVEAIGDLADAVRDLGEFPGECTKGFDDIGPPLRTLRSAQDGKKG